MRVFRTEKQLRDAPEFPGKDFLVSVLEQVRAGYESEALDILADCGVFYLIEAGDDVTSLRLHDGAEGVDLTDPDRMVYEFVDMSDNGRYFALFWMVGNAGGPVFFAPREMDEAFRRVLPGREAD